MTEPHLDDEQLSLLLDSVSPDGRAHVEQEGCGVCGARLAALRTARDAVAAAAVPPMTDDVLDRMVAAALDAAAVADVVPLTAASRRRRRITTPPPAWLIGAAAGIAALVGVAGVLRVVDETTSSGDDAGSLALEADEQSAKLARDAGGGVGGATSDATASAPVDPELVTFDLADQDDPAALALALGPLSGTVLGAESFARSDAVREVRPTADGAATGAGASTGPTGAAPPPSTVDPDRAQCRTQADAIGGGRFAGLISTATVRWKGEPAEVLVFRLAHPSTEDPPLTRQALVLSRPGCRLLADPRF